MAAADVTDEVWDHVLLGAPAPRESALPAALLARMRREFQFWYPFDLRVRRQGLAEEGWGAACAGDDDVMCVICWAWQGCCLAFVPMSASYVGFLFS